MAPLFSRSEDHSTGFHLEQQACCAGRARDPSVEPVGHDQALWMTAHADGWPTFADHASGIKTLVDGLCGRAVVVIGADQSRAGRIRSKIACQAGRIGHMRCLLYATTHRGATTIINNKCGGGSSLVRVIPYSRLGTDSVVTVSLKTGGAACWTNVHA